MLNAIIHSKAGRIKVDKDIDKTSLSWRQLYQQREDLLTSAFFSRFTYLSGLLQHRLLKKWLGGGDFTEFKGVDYWPRYELPNHKSRNFVEPDLLLRFADCDLLVEVKPPEGGDQYHEQWRLEIEGYYDQESQTKPLYFLAIGRVGKILAEFDTDAIRGVHDRFQLANAREWQPIAYELRKLFLSHDLDAQDKRIVEDMLESLKLYGIRSQELRWDVLPKLYAKQSLNLNVMDAWPS